MTAVFQGDKLRHVAQPAAAEGRPLNLLAVGQIRFNGLVISAPAFDIQCEAVVRPDAAKAMKEIRFISDLITGDISVADNSPTCLHKFYRQIGAVVPKV